MGLSFIGLYYLLHRYYFFGKHTAIIQRATPAEVWQQRAKDNKRDWGYNANYKPQLEISRKKAIMEAMGSKPTLIQIATTRL